MDDRDSTTLRPRERTGLQHQRVRPIDAPPLRVDLASDVSVGDAELAQLVAMEHPVLGTGQREEAGNQVEGVRASGHAGTVRESMVSIEHLLPSIVPSMAPAYLAAATSLPSLVAPDRYEELAASVRGSTLRQSNRRAQAIVRSYLPAPAAVAPQDATATQSAVATPSLTPRERDVMQQLIAGGTNREIGEALGMTPKTVMHHTVAIYRKLGVRGRAEAVAWALRSGQA